MAHVVLCYLNLAAHIIEFCGGDKDVQEARDQLKDIEERWLKEENTLFFLAFLLHPQFQATAAAILEQSKLSNGNWMSNRNPLTEARLRHAAVFYSGKFNLFKSDEADQRKTQAEDLSRQFQLWTKLRVKSGTDITNFTPGSNAVTWWQVNQDELPELATLSWFLLDAPVQGADCERLFKDLARYHSKSRNRLQSDTNFNSSAILHDMKRKYGNDYRVSSATGSSKKRLVSSIEYPRIDNPPSPDRSVTVPETVLTLPDDSSMKSESNDDEVSGNGDEDELDLTHTTQMTAWLTILSNEVEETDESVEPSDVPVDDPIVTALALFEDSDDEAPSTSPEDSYEKRADPLPSLPGQNDANYPQENRTYLATKKYVRNDKYKLQDMVDKIELPPILYAFEQKPKK